MTLEELRAEAKKHGYKLIKDTPYVRLAPCVCGHKGHGQYADWSNKKHHITSNVTDVASYLNLQKPSTKPNSNGMNASRTQKRRKQNEKET